jgi:anti-anti-sigma factor
MDLAGAEYISSAGWGIFLAEIKRIRENGGDLKLSAMVPNVREIFELLEFNYILRAYDSIDAAVADFTNVMVDF